MNQLERFVKYGWRIFHRLSFGRITVSRNLVLGLWHRRIASRPGQVCASHTDDCLS